MKCIYCREDTKVTNSRLQKTRNQVWRRRHCQQCGADFTTLEKPDFLTALTVTHKKYYTPFSRDKLFLSVYESVKHRKTALSDATALTDTIVGKLYPLIQSGSLTQDQIVTIASEALHHFDKAAASHYNAYHPIK